MQDSPVIEQLTAFEMSMAEKTAGLSIATLEDANFPKVDLLGALAWVWRKREHPTLTFKDFMQNTSLEAITSILGLSGGDDDEEEEPDPTEDTRTSTSG